jgi:hypothetical protein
MGEIIGRSMLQATVGGTLSKITGGKFANGAITAAIQYVVNATSRAINAAMNRSQSSERAQLARERTRMGVKSYMKYEKGPFSIKSSGMDITNGERTSSEAAYTQKVAGALKIDISKDSAGTVSLTGYVGVGDSKMGSLARVGLHFVKFVNQRIIQS